jgi:hypothetical protein
MSSKFLEKIKLKVNTFIKVAKKEDFIEKKMEEACHFSTNIHQSCTENYFANKENIAALMKFLLTGN